MTAPAGPKYLNIPNLFLYASVVTFVVALVIGASIQLSVVQFGLFLALVVVAIGLYLKMFAAGLKGNRDLTMKHLGPNRSGTRPSSKAAGEIAQRSSQ